MRVRVCIDVRLTLKRKKQLLFSSGNIGYVYFKYEWLTMFYYLCGKLGHNDSFCRDRMALKYEPTKLGWDLSIKA